ncbi:Y-family DNA polymerase [Pontibacter diazotrophicus]|nr:hypothetical protein [Pontibacter diazotrophicus]
MVPLHEFRQYRRSEVEVYSIDKSFLDLGNFYNVNLQDYARTMKDTVRLWTGIPVAVGVAPTKTLAKVANQISKKSAKASGVLVLTDERHIEEALKRTEVGDVWGIGPRYARKLATFDITTVWQLHNATDAFAKKHLTVAGLRTVRALHSMPCIYLEMIPPARQNICTSLSFGSTFTELDEIKGGDGHPYRALHHQDPRPEQLCRRAHGFPADEPVQRPESNLLQQQHR